MPLPPRSTAKARPEPARLSVQPHGQAADYAAEHVIPAHLLGGGEVVILAIKPSLWFILFVSARGLILIALALLLALQVPNWIWPFALSGAALVKVSLALAALRLAVAVLQWVSRLYVLTNRRVMRIRGIFNVDLFECPLIKIQNTFLTLALYERLCRLGSIHFATAGTGQIEATWQHIAHPLEAHEQVRDAITRAHHHPGASNL